MSLEVMRKAVSMVVGREVQADELAEFGNLLLVNRNLYFRRNEVTIILRDYEGELPDGTRIYKNGEFVVNNKPIFRIQLDDKFLEFAKCLRNGTQLIFKLEGNMVRLYGIAIPNPFLLEFVTRDQPFKWLVEEEYKKLDGYKFYVPVWPCQLFDSNLILELSLYRKRFIEESRKLKIIL